MAALYKLALLTTLLLALVHACTTDTVPEQSGLSVKEITTLLGSLKTLYHKFSLEKPGGRFLSSIKFNLFGLPTDMFEVFATTVYAIGIGINVVVIYLYYITRYVSLPGGAALSEQLEGYGDQLDQLASIEAKLANAQVMLNQLNQRPSRRR